MADELQHGRNCDALAHPVDGDCTCGLIYRKEIAACIDLIPENLRVQVREGGGPENLCASLAVSVANLVRELKVKQSDLNNLHDAFSRSIEARSKGL